MFIMQAAGDERLSLGEILTGIPHDGPAIVAYVILALFAGFIWWGSRTSGKRSEDAAAQDSPSAQKRS